MNKVWVAVKEKGGVVKNKGSHGQAFLIEEYKCDLVIVSLLPEKENNVPIQWMDWVVCDEERWMEYVEHITKGE